MAQISEKTYQTSIAGVYYVYCRVSFSFRVIGMALILPMPLGCKRTVEMLYDCFFRYLI